jgi:hypothetical protein
MTQPTKVLRQIRLKSCAPTFSGTDFVSRKTCVKHRSVFGVFRARMSLRDFCASVRAQRQYPHEKRDQSCGLGYGDICTKTRAAA